MTDPVSLKDRTDVDPAVRELLREGAGAAPMTQADRDAIWSGVRSAVALASAGAVAAKVATSAKPLGWFGLSKAVIALSGLALGGVVAGAAMMAARSAPPPEAPVSQATSAPSAAPAVIPSIGPDIDAVLLPTGSSEVAPPAPAASPVPSLAVQPSAKARKPAIDVPKQAAAAPDSAQEDTLVVEEALVSKARRSVETAPNEALAALASHARQFPSGQLAPERDYLHVRALKKAGRLDEARSRATAYPSRYPRSPFTGRVAAMLAEMSP